MGAVLNFLELRDLARGVALHRPAPETTVKTIADHAAAMKILPRG
jgi:hypothetical protein